MEVGVVVLVEWVETMEGTVEGTVGVEEMEEGEEMVEVEVTEE